jgi:hypothetical protein
MLSELAMCFADHNPVNWDVCVGRYTRVGLNLGASKHDPTKQNGRLKHLRIGIGVAM